MRFSAMFGSIFLITGLGAPASVHANLWNSLVGGDPACQIDDQDCIRSLYIGEIIQRTKDDSSPTYAARDFARQTTRWTEAERQKALDTISAEKLGEDFFADYEQENELIDAESAFDYAGIERAVRERIWPEAMEWQNFIESAVNRTLTVPDQAESLWRLWQQEQDFFEEYAEGPSVAIMSWGLIHKTDETLSYLASDLAMPQVAMRGLDAFASAAAWKCDEGETQATEALRLAYDHYAATQKYESVAEFLPLRSKAVIALSCGSRAEADLAFTTLADLVDQKIASQGKTFETDWANSRLEDVAYAYALRAHILGDDEAARKYLERGASRGMIIAMQTNDNATVEVSVWDVLVDGNWPEYTENATSRLTEELSSIEERNEAKAYDPDLNVRYSYFANDFDPKFEICCSQAQLLETMMDTIEEANASRDVGPAARKLLKLIERYEAVSGERLAEDLPLTLRLATLDRKRGCAHSTGLQEAWLSQVSQEEYSKTRADALAHFLDYMAVEAGPSTPDGCYFSD